MNFISSEEQSFPAQPKRPSQKAAKRVRRRLTGTRLYRLNPETADEHALRNLRETLDGEENRKADRLENAARHREFVISRGFVREKLSEFLAIDPRDIRIERGTWGKPLLPGDLCFFNLTHKGPYLALAVSDKGPIGIDLETVSVPPERGLRIARRYFSASESEFLENLGESRFGEGFGTFWALKEAFLKTLGVGIRGGLRQAELRLPPEFSFKNHHDRLRYAFHLEKWDGHILCLCLQTEENPPILHRDYPPAELILHSDFGRPSPFSR